MKKNIEVKEKNLIDKMNEKIAYDKVCDRWDNNGPVQFEEENKIDPETYHVGENFKDNRDKYYDKDVKVREKTVTLQPRNPDGTFAKAVYNPECSLEDTAESRMNCDDKKAKEIEKKIGALIRQNKGTRSRTSVEEDPFPGHIEDTYEYVNHPRHYNNYDVEVIEMMERIFGLDETIAFCKLNAFKYRQRMGTKPGTPVDQDLKKEQWYLDKMAELKKKKTKE